jgi:hypothetical protein
MIMNYFEKVKDYLLELNYEITYEDAPEGILRITNQEKGLFEMILDCEGEILIMEQHIFDIDTPNSNTYKRLLQINRTFVHGAFVLTEDGQKVLYRDTLQLANLDLNELEASLNSLALALIENTDELLTFAATPA